MGAHPPGSVGCVGVEGAHGLPGCQRGGVHALAGQDAARSRHRGAVHRCVIRARALQRQQRALVDQRPYGYDYNTHISDLLSLLCLLQKLVLICYFISYIQNVHGTRLITQMNVQQSPIVLLSLSGH